MLVDIAVEVRPSGYRVTARPGRDQRRAIDFLRVDLDAFDEAIDPVRPPWVKVQAAGPWTLAASVELRSGHTVLTDRGAVREFAASLAEGLRAHLAEVAARTGAAVLLQLDEPSLPAVLAGRVPTPSGYGTVRAVSETAAADVLRDLVAAVGVPVVVHCCADRPPLGVLGTVGAVAIGVDATAALGGGAHRVARRARRLRRGVGRGHAAAAGHGARPRPRRPPDQPRAGPHRVRPRRPARLRPRPARPPGRPDPDAAGSRAPTPTGPAARSPSAASSARRSSTRPRTATEPARATLPGSAPRERRSRGDHSVADRAGLSVRLGSLAP